MKILIIEDEKPLAEYLSASIQKVAPESQVLAIIPSVEEGLEYLMQTPEIDLIFSDIQLGDGTSFEIFEQVNNKVPVVFCTAFDQYTLKAFDSMGIHYILKPFSMEDVAKAIEKFRLLQPSPTPIPDFTSIIQHIREQATPVSMPSVIMYQGDQIIPVSGNDVALFYIRNNAVYAHTIQGKEWAVNQKMDALEQKFQPFFYRANRQFLVNRKAINSASQHFHRKIALSLTIDFPETILVGKEKVTDFLKWLSER